MRLGERLGRHASEASLLAIVAGEAVSPHVASCAPCQARLGELRAWVDGTAAEAGAAADEVFTPERLAAQKQSVLARLEAAGRSARVIAFPLGSPAPARRSAQVIRWAAAAAVAGVLVGLASGRLLDPHTAAPPQAPALAGNTPSPARPASGPREALDEGALLDAAYDRISIGALQTIDDMTPRTRDIVLASTRGRR